MRRSRRTWLTVSALWLSLSWSLAAAAPGPASVPPPAALQEISKAVLEDNSKAQQLVLEQFAQEYQDQLHGVLAHLALGYYAYQSKNYAAAKEQFEAARRAPTLLQDYADYYLAMSQLALGDTPAAAQLLDGFETRYRASPMAAQAVIQSASALLQMQRPAEVIARLQNASIALPQPGAAFLLAQAYQRAQQSQEAVASFRTVFYSYPASAAALDSKKQLDALRAKMGDAYPAASAAQLQERAEKLYQAGRWRDAQEAYRALAAAATGSLREQAQVRVGVCQYQLGSTWPSLTTLQKIRPEDGDADAERLYTMAAAYRRLGRQEQMEEQIQTLAARYPQSEWYEQALLLAGNYHLLAKEYDEAGQYYQKSYELFPEGDSAAMGQWRLAWQAYRERRLADAQRLLEEHIRNFPNSPQISAALYWLGRLAEPESATLAAEYYQKILEVFPNYYYSLLARQRLVSLPSPSSQGSESAPLPAVSLDRIQRRVAPPDGDGVALQQPYRERTRLLESAWLMDWAIDEMRFVVAKDAAALWAGNEMARLEKERGRYHLALRYAKKYIPSYFAQDTDALPRDTWELLFPKPYWDQIRKQALAAHLDPYLVAGLIRQESEFDPQARSRSNARGLMQLLPSTARIMARSVPDPKARRYRLAALFQPDINIVYGTFYLRKVLDQFNGVVEYALAGYNAGENRVVEWLQAGPFDDPAEFVENIPFTETREYVQAVLRNAALYRALYPDGS